MNRKGFAPILVALIIAGVLVVVGIWYYESTKSSSPPPSSNLISSSTQTSSTNNQSPASPNAPSSLSNGASYLNASTLLATTTNQEKNCLFQTDNTPVNCGQGITFYANGSKAAYVIQQNGKWVLVTNGQEGEPYDAIYPQPGSDSQGKHAAFIAENNGHQFVILDGQQGKGYQDIITAESGDMGGGPVSFVDALNQDGNSDSYSDGLVFSPDGNHLSYPAHVGDQWKMIYDGNEGTTYNSVSPGVFSPDSKHFAYVVSNNSFDNPDSFVVLDGQEGKHYSGNIGGVIFSPDSQRLAYVVSEGNVSAPSRFVVVNGQEGLKYIYVGPLFFSSDSKMLAYAAATDTYNRPQFVVLNNKVSKSYFNIFDYTLSFSPDNTRLSFITQEGQSSAAAKRVVTVDQNDSVIYENIYSQVSIQSPGFPSIVYQGTQPAYVVSTSSQMFVVVGDQVSKSFSKIGNIVSSSNGAHFIYTLERDNQWFANVDGQEMGGYDEVGYPEFSRDGNHWGFSFRKGNQWTVVIDGKNVGTYDSAPSNSIIFNSLDQPAFAAQQNGKWFMMVNGQKEGNYDQIINNVQQHPFFNSQGDKAIYIARSGKQWFVTMGGATTTQGYDNILTQPAFIASSGALGYNAMVNNQIWWVVQ